MSTREIQDRLSDILHHINQLEEFFENLALQSFLKSNKDIFAIAMCYTIIGEAVAHIPNIFKKEYPYIPWREIKDMRNFAVHQYWEVNPKILWNTFHQNIPELKIQIQEIVQNMND